MTVKKLKRVLKDTFLTLSLSTKTSINYFEKLTYDELIEWIEVSNDYVASLNKKLRR